jgi:hypothetical protein
MIMFSSKAHEGNSLGGGSGMQEAQVISSDSQGESKKAKNDLLEAEDLRSDHT